MFKGCSKIQLIAIAGMAIALPQARADIRQRVSVPGFEDSQTGGSDYGGRVDIVPGGAPGVRAGDLASFGMTVTTLDGNTHNLCTDSGLSVQRGPAFTSLGTHFSGNDSVRVQWQEVPSSSSVSFVNIVIRTTNGGALFPSSHPSGSPVVSWKWNIGGSNPIDFRSTTEDMANGTYIHEVRLNSASAYFSRNSGRSFYQAQLFIPTTGVYFYPNTPASAPDPATGSDLKHVVFSDPGFDQFNVNDGANYLLIRYELAFFVPSPGSLALLTCGLISFGRRRREN